MPRPATNTPGTSTRATSTPAIILALILAIVAAWLLNGVADGRLPEQVPLSLAGADGTTMAGQEAADDSAGATQTLSETRPLRE